MKVQSQFIEMVGDPRTNPKGWKVYQLPDIASYSIGLTYKPEHVCNDGTIVLRSGNIKNGQIVLDDLVRVNSLIKDSLWVKQGDILMCSRNGSAMLVGKVAQIKSLTEPMTYGAFMTIVRSEYSDFLYLYFQSANFREQISGGKSSTMNQITQKMLDKIEIPLPNKNILLSLSSILKQADKSKFVGFKSQFIEMFDLERNSLSWPVMCFKDFASLDCSMTTDFEIYAEYPHIGIDSIEQNTGILSGYRTVKEDNVKSGKYKFTARHIIYSKIRPNLNKVATPDFEGLCSADAYPILAKENVIYKDFLAFILRSDKFLNYIVPLSNRTGMPKVNREQVEGFTCPIPPKEAQDRFISILQQSDKSKFELNKSIEAIDAVIKSLINS